MISHAIGQRFGVSRGGCWQCLPDCRIRLAEALRFFQVAYNMRYAKVRQTDDNKRQRMNSTARAARREALKRHRRQMLATAVMSTIIGIAINEMRRSESWESGTGPAMQKLEVRAYGFVGKDGKWRSYDTGEPIEVIGWR